MAEVTCQFFRVVVIGFLEMSSLFGGEGFFIGGHSAVLCDFAVGLNDKKYRNFILKYIISINKTKHIY